MKLFFIIDNNEPHESGGGYYAIFKFAEFLAKRNHDISIYAVNDLGWLGADSKANCYYRYKIPRKNRLMRKVDKIISNIYDMGVLEREIRRVKPDWILGVLTESAIKAVKYGKRYNILVANFIYECPPWVENMVGTDRFQREYVGYIRNLWNHTKEAYTASDILFPNSELSRTYNSTWLEGKKIAEPIYPGIDVEQMPILESAETGPSGRFRILYVGRLVDTKNVDLLIRVFKRFNSNAELHICGDGPDRDRLVTLAGGSDRIVFHGFVSDEKLWTFYNSCVFVVFPSSFEGFGMPPMQALYFGKPCIVSDIPIFRSIYGDYLEYFSLKDPEQLHDAMDRLLSDRKYRLMRGKEGREFVLRKFRWSISAEKIENNLQDFIDKSR